MADHCFGIVALLHRPETNWLDAYNGYTSKFGFFVDETKREVIGLNVQGQEATNKASGKAFGKLTGKLGMDPRAYLLQHVMATLREEGIKKIKILRVAENPLTLENHPGFTGRYERPVKEAGIIEEEGVYLVKNLADS